mgnify:CR=1 FL=1
MIEVLFNNEATQITEGSTLQSILESRKLSTKNGIAVAINASVIPRGEWENYVLQQNDKLMVISATAGG